MACAKVLRCSRERRNASMTIIYERGKDNLKSRMDKEYTTFRTFCNQEMLSHDKEFEVHLFIREVHDGCKCPNLTF